MAGSSPAMTGGAGGAITSRVDEQADWYNCMLYPKLGIIVLNWNSWRETMDCVNSLQHLEYPNYAVYIVDNASSDGSEDRLRAWNPALRIIQSGANLGWAGGNNAGIQIARAEACYHVYLLNSDTTVRSDTLSLLVQ